jgi:hypothetical protein
MRLSRTECLLVASTLVLTNCSRIASFRPTQLAALQALSTNRTDEVVVQDDEDDELTITRRTRLTLHFPGSPPIESVPERMGFSATTLRLGTAFESQAVVIPYTQIARVDARVHNLTGTLLAVFIPVGLVLALFIGCLGGGCQVASGER